MRKLLFILLAFIPWVTEAQNLQMHYDLGKDRKYYTATLEMFKADSFGITYWFVDFDFNFPGSPRSISSVYGEISHDFFLPWLKHNQSLKELGFHLEYDDGFGILKDSMMLQAISYNPAYLTGFSYPVKLGPIKLTTQWMLRMPRGMKRPDFQFTLVWYQPLFHNKLLVSGYMDIWSQDQHFGKDKKELVCQSQPQFWYLVRPKLGLGTELDISRNFPHGPQPWRLNPTLAFRWEF